MTDTKASVELRRITGGPKYHWFGYYDKLQFDPSDRLVLAMEVDFEHRSPTNDDVISLGYIDIADGDRWTTIGTSRSWCWQQGCMLQWLPGSSRKVLWNDLESDHFITRLVDLDTGSKHIVDHPFYTIHPDGKSAIGADFRRINHMRPGYGYPGPADPNFNVPAPEDSGIHALDLETGKASLIVPISAAASLPSPHCSFGEAKHYFNHLLFNPSGSRFIFLHRWRSQRGGFTTRLLTAAADGSDIRVVDDYGGTSHFIWKDDEHILAWSTHPSHGSAFYLYTDVSIHETGEPEVEPVGLSRMIVDGHCTYLPGGTWILNDTYPGSDGTRTQQLYMYNPESETRIELGAFESPAPYTGEWRCDLHPRSSRNGRYVTVDSPHTGPGRQIYLLDISELTSR